MRLVLVGPPGSGKGTQAVTLAAQLEVPHIATGDVFRAEMAAETDLGKLAREYIAGGDLVPDDVVNAMMCERLAGPDGLAFVLDGYPRTLPQAESLDRLLKVLLRPLDRVLHIRVADDVIVERAVGRLVCPKCGAIYHLTSKPPHLMGVCDLCRGVLETREDDQPSTVRHRLAVYHRITEPVLNYYRELGLVREVDGIGSREQVAGRLHAEL